MTIPDSYVPTGRPALERRSGPPSAGLPGYGSSVLDPLATQNGHPLDQRLVTPSDAGSPSIASVRTWQRVGARALDLSIAVVTIAALLPVMLLIAVAIKATSEGPVFFRQTRAGRDRRPFTVLKFRTMVDGAHSQLRADPELFAEYVKNDFKLSHDDARITRLGAVLRKTSLDELPQLFNVVAGSMSIVGVRPLLPDELALRPHGDQELYGSRRPGMTGLWQVRGRSSVQGESRLTLDREYLSTWCLWRDVLIVLQTPLALLRIHHSR